MKRLIKSFRIKEEYITSITIHEPIRIAFYNGSTVEGISTRSEDHPKFSELRERLGEEGFITIERSWWNGDRVIKPFKLNGMSFKKGAQFSCAGAMNNSLQVRKERNKK